MNEENNHGHLLYWEGKHGPWFCYARTPEEEQAAYLKLFRLMDDCGFYSYGDTNEQEDQLIGRAREGDSDAAWALIQTRSDRGCEYEHMSIEKIEDPFSK